MKVGSLGTESTVLLSGDVLFGEELAERLNEG
jgi:hypothetical protein